MIVARAARNVGRALKSLAPSVALLAAAPLSGCYGDGYYYHYGPPPGRSFSLPPCPNATAPVRGVSIDTDAQLTTDASQGAGSAHRVRQRRAIGTSSPVCDTAISGYPCEFDITAQAIGGKVSRASCPRTSSPTTSRRRSARTTAMLGVTTGTDFDGLWFDTAPGAAVRVTAALGQARYDDIFY